MEVLSSDVRFFLSAWLTHRLANRKLGALELEKPLLPMGKVARIRSQD